jgi:ABC-type transport system substrate-binding protein
LKIIPGAGPGSPFGWPAESTGAGVYLLQISLETLVRRDKLGNTEPWLATKWDIALDGKSITFQLRKGVKFHDGTDFNAQAVKYIFDKLIAGKTSGAGNWTSIDAVDDHTVRINLKRWESLMLSQLGGTRMHLPSPTAYEKNGLDWVRWNAVGTGPFKQASFDRDIQSTFARFDGYWQPGKPYVDELQYIFITDETTASLAFAKGESQILWMSSPVVRDNLDKSGFKYLSAGADKGLGSPMMLLPDSANADSILAKPKVRQAIEHAIDRESVKQLGRGDWEGAYQVSPSLSWGFNKSLEASYRKYDPKKAKELLAEAGVPNGFKTRIITSNSAVRQQMEPVVQYLKEVGIEAPIDFVTLPKYNELHQRGWKDGLLATAQFGGATSTLVHPITYNVWTTQWYVSVEKSDAFKKLTEGLLTSADEATEKKLSQDLAKVMFDEAWVIPVWREELGPKAGPLMIDGVKGGAFNYGEAAPWYKSETIWLEPKARLFK